MATNPSSSSSGFGLKGLFKGLGGTQKPTADAQPSTSSSATPGSADAGQASTSQAEGTSLSLASWLPKDQIDLRKDVKKLSYEDALKRYGFEMDPDYYGGILARSFYPNRKIPQISLQEKEARKQELRQAGLEPDNRDAIEEFLCKLEKQENLQKVKQFCQDSNPNIGKEIQQFCEKYNKGLDDVYKLLLKEHSHFCLVNDQVPIETWLDQKVIKHALEALKPASPKKPEIDARPDVSGTAAAAANISKRDEKHLVGLASHLAQLTPEPHVIAEVEKLVADFKAKHGIR